MMSPCSPKNYQITGKMKSARNTFQICSRFNNSFVLAFVKEPILKVNKAVVKALCINSVYL